MARVMAIAVRVGVFIANVLLFLMMKPTFA